MRTYHTNLITADMVRRAIESWTRAFPGETYNFIPGYIFDPMDHMAQVRAGLNWQLRTQEGHEPVPR